MSEVLCACGHSINRHTWAGCAAMRREEAKVCDCGLPPSEVAQAAIREALAPVLPPSFDAAIREAVEGYIPEPYGTRTEYVLATIRAVVSDPDATRHDTQDGQANTCRHLSATGVDTAPIGPTKVWACDHCGLRWRADALDSATLGGGCLHGPNPTLGTCPNCGTVVDEAELARVAGRAPLDPDTHDLDPRQEAQR